MLPRRSIRIGQRISQTESAAVASSSIDATFKQAIYAAAKRTRSSISEDDTSDPHKQKKMKLDNDGNNSFASISLLESLPNEILKEIFIRSDDVGLLNLANTCTRFEAIALAVAPKIYSNRYCVIKGERLGGDPDIYAAQFNRFGSSIGAIEVNHIENIGVNHWLAKILQPHIGHITKLTFSNCTFNRNDNFSLPMDNVTHLVLHNVSFGRNFDLSKCRKLIKLDLRTSYSLSEKKLAQIIRNNPALQSIIQLSISFHKQSSIIDHLHQIKELGTVCFDWLNEQPDAMNRIVSMLKNLESLALAICPGRIEFLPRLGFECKRIKHLELNSYYMERLQRYGLDELIAAIRPFKQVESLKWIDYYREDDDKIELALKHLPNLRQLHFEVPNYECVYSKIVSLLRECPTLERITVAADYMDEFVCTQFFKEFIETITITGKLNTRIEFEQHRKIVGSVTGNGFVWQNKLMYWIGCEQNDTNIHLLALTNQLEKCTEKPERGRDAVQRNLLDQIFDYLDMHSLHFFAETSPRSKQLVENYITVYSKQKRTFTITNEFYQFKHYDEMHKMFAPHITNLKLINFHRLNCFNRDFTIFSGYKQLTKVSIYNENFNTCWNLPQSVRHVVFDGAFFMDGFDYYMYVSMWIKHVEILEFKNASKFNDIESIRTGALKFTNLKKFIFNYRSEAQIENLKKIFKNTNIQLIPIFSNSTAN